NYEPLGAAAPLYEGYDEPGLITGWRHLMDEDHPAFVRKPLLTTVNGAVRTPPPITQPSMPSSPVLPVGGVFADVDTRLRQLWSIGMSWPVLVSDASPLDVVNEAPQTGAPPLNGTLADDLVVAADRMP